MQYFLPLFILSATLGLAPFTPEPHLFGKIKWIIGGGEGMQLMDYLDALMHASPILLLIGYSIRYFLKKRA